MPASYFPGSAHVAPVTAAVGSGSVAGLSPGRCFVTVADPYAPTTVWLPTALTSDGFPGAMLPFTTATGSVT